MQGISKKGLNKDLDATTRHLHFIFNFQEMHLFLSHCCTVQQKNIFNYIRIVYGDVLLLTCTEKEEILIIYIIIPIYWSEISDRCTTTEIFFSMKQLEK